MIKKIHFKILVIVLIASFVGGLIYVKNAPEPESKSLISATVALDQYQFEETLSSYDHQRASEHFANVILGWTVEPSFADEFGEIDFSGRRQEKQNLIFTVHTDEDAELDRFVSLIQQRLDEYNVASQTEYTLAPVRYSGLEVVRSEVRVIGGVVLLSLLICILTLIGYDSVSQNRRRS